MHERGKMRLQRHTMSTPSGPGGTTGPNGKGSGCLGRAGAGEAALEGGALVGGRLGPGVVVGLQGCTRPTVSRCRSLAAHW